MIGWMPSTATRKPFHIPSTRREQRARRRSATSTVAGCPGSGEPRMIEQATAPGDRHDRADREVDAAGGDDERHAERDEQRSARRCAGCRSGCRTGGRRAPSTVKKPGNAIRLIARARSASRSARRAAGDEPASRAASVPVIGVIGRISATARLGGAAGCDRGPRHPDRVVRVGDERRAVSRR